MPRYDFRTPRIYLDAPLAAGNEVSLDHDQTNYLLNVLRLRQGDGVLLFNGRDGEWQAELAGTGKRALTAEVGERMREQPRPVDLHFLFAPLKHARLDYLVQKAVEMGVSLLQPVITRHTQVARRQSRAHARQCDRGRAAVRRSGLAGGRRAGGVQDHRRDRRCRPSAGVLRRGRRREGSGGGAGRGASRRGRRNLPLAVLIGPEGGFADDEREALLKRPNVVRIALGPRILRADTAAVAALALVQAVLGDWRDACKLWAAHLRRGCRRPAGNQRR